MSFSILVYTMSFHALVAKVLATKFSNCFSLILCVYFDCGFLFLYINTSKLSKTNASTAFCKEQSASRISITLKWYAFTLHRASKRIVCMSLITIVHYRMTKYDDYDRHGTSHKGYHG